MHLSKGFTLIELMVVIAIIGLLMAAGAVAFSNATMLARDSRRKADLNAIYKALNIYYTENGLYPAAGACAYGTNCYVYSSTAGNWIPALAPYFASSMPRDPKNTGGAPWAANGYYYSYGNVSADGQVFDLTSHLENSNDPDRCGIRDYRLMWYNAHWCTAFGGAYHNQIYELSP